MNNTQKPNYRVMARRAHNEKSFYREGSAEYVRLQDLSREYTILAEKEESES